MRRLTAVAAIVVALAGCGTIRKTFGIKDAPPAHREPQSTSIYGDWVLASPDSTAFAGAKTVEMSLQQTSFAINASYPSRPTVMVSGTVIYRDGLLTLTPTGGSNDTGPLGVAFTPGKPIVITASAAGGTLVFAPPPSGAGTAVVPSSVWHKKAMAEAAGKVSP